MKSFLLLAIAAILGLGLVQSEALAKNSKKSQTQDSRAWSEDGRNSRGYEKWQELTPAQRHELEERYQKFKELSPEQQQKLRRRYERFKDLPPEKQKKILERHQRIQQLSPQQREQLRKEWKQLKELPPEQRSQRRREIRREFFGDNGVDNGNADNRGEVRERRR
jgi:hypothetical protein